MGNPFGESPFGKVRDASPRFSKAPDAQKRVLFVSEAVSLAHVGRPLVLARWAREAGYEVHFACGPAYEKIVRAEGFEPIELTTLITDIFYKRLEAGRFFYTERELEAYVQAELELLDRLQPDLVVGDFRLTLDISTTLRGIPLLGLGNAHWNPQAVCAFPAPRAGLLRLLPLSLRNRVFELLRSFAFRHFAAPLERVRRRFGLPPLGDFRRHYTAGSGCAYLDLPELYGADSLSLPPGHFFLGPVPWAPHKTTDEFTTEARRHGDNSFQEYEQPFSVSPCLRGEPCRSGPLAYVSLGSSGDTRVLPDLLRALVAAQCSIVLSGVGAAEEAALRRTVCGLEGRLWAAPLLDPREILESASITVCHGGSGTVYQSLSAGVPLLCLPGNPDQALVSAALARRGAGIAVDSECVTPARLRAALAALLDDLRYRRTAGVLARALQARDTRTRWLNFLKQACPATGPPRPELGSGSDSPLEDRRLEAPLGKEPPMLTVEDRELLGMTPETRAARRPSAVSQVLRAIREDVECGTAAWDLAGAEADESLSGGRLILACDRATRRRAYALAQRVYAGCGYVVESVAGCVSAFDADPQTLTLLIEDAHGSDAATISLVFDSSAGLPCDEIYSSELGSLRAHSRRLVEVTRLAIAPEHTRSKPLLVRLFNFIYIFARKVKGYDDFLIEVNPRHVAYYRRLLGFEVAGAERPCPRVQGAPAVLLRLDLAHPESEVRRVGGRGPVVGERTLYPYFYTWLEEGAVAEFLACRHQPMTAEERNYFGLAGLRAPATRRIESI